LSYGGCVIARCIGNPSQDCPYITSLGRWVIDHLLDDTVINLKIPYPKVSSLRT